MTLIYLDECRYGAASEFHLSSCVPPLILLAHTVIRCTPRHLDHAIICGHRGKEAQNAAYAAGNSEKQWPEGEHNQYPSPALDLRPASPFVAEDWNDKIRFARIVGLWEAVAAQLSIRIRCGLDWNMNGKSNDQKFMDLGHIEYVGARAA